MTAPNYKLPLDALPTDEPGPNDGHENPPPHVREHPIPEDSVIAEYRAFCRDFCEAPDAWSGALVLPVLARLLTPNVWIDFAGKKPITLFHFIAGPAGMRKSTAFYPAEAIAHKLFPPDCFVTGNASDSALFDVFEAEPHRIQFEDEGNTILKTWANTHSGKEVSARYLKLYDGQSWGQTFRRAAKDHDDGEAQRLIPAATLSFIIASTFGVSRFDGIDAASGLRRRFGYYVATDPARMIYWPRSFGRQEAEHFADKFRPLSTLEGRVGSENFTLSALDLWTRIQDENREQCAALGISVNEEAQGAALNESPARILKLALIFQASRWARNQSLDPFEIDAPTLELAAAHQAACLEAAASLDVIGQRAAINEEADVILARIRTDFAERLCKESGRIVLNKTDLTSRYASHPGRLGATTPTRLYHEIIPALIARGDARIESRKGKGATYSFTYDD